MTEVAHKSTNPSGMDILTVHISERDGVVVVSIAGELDMATVRKVDPVLDDAITRGKSVVIDMSGLTFFASTGLTVLARLDEHRRQVPLDVCLVADQRAVILPLRMTGLYDLFPLYPTMPDALNATVDDVCR